MSRLQRQIQACYGVEKFLSDVTGNTYTEKKANKVMYAFLVAKGLKAWKWNNRYKGLRTAAVVNAEMVQEHWHEFREWVNINLPNQ